MSTKLHLSRYFDCTCGERITIQVISSEKIDINPSPSTTSIVERLERMLQEQKLDVWQTQVIIDTVNYIKREFI